MSVISTAIGYVAAVVSVPLMIFVIALRRLFDYSRRFDGAFHFTAAFILATFGIRIRVEGVRHLQLTGPVLFITNHVNIFDGFVMVRVLPLPFRALELDDHFRWPVYGTATRLFGAIPLSHRALSAAMQSLERARRVLVRGTSVLVLPEGHRTRTGKLQPFMRGPFRLAKRAGVPIVPVAMLGAYERKRVGSLRVRPGVVRVRVGEAIGRDRVEKATEGELRAEAMERMKVLAK